MGKVQNYLAKLDQATIYGEKYKKKWFNQCEACIMMWMLKAIYVQMLTQQMWNHKKPLIRILSKIKEPII